jgi:hypothetical protein
METITLNGVSNIARSENETTSKTGIDRGSTFITLLCKACQAEVGRCYIATSRFLDPIRDMFTLNSGAIASYVLGNPDFKTDAPKELLNAGTELKPEIELRVFKMQNVILALSERITKLENGLQQQQDDSPLRQKRRR